MKRTPLTTFAGAALAAAVSLGMAAPAASAAPATGHHATAKAAHGKAATAASGHGKSAKAGKGGKAGKAAAGKAKAAAKRLAVGKRTVTRWVVQKDAALARASQRVTSAGLADATTVQANITTDRAFLDGLRQAAADAATLADVRAVGRQVKQVRPEVYSAVVNGLLGAGEVAVRAAADTAAIAELTTATDAAELAGYDVTAVRAALQAASTATDEAAALAASAVAQGTTLTARSSHADRRAFAEALATAVERLAEADAQIVVATDALAGAVLPPVEPVDPGEPVV